MEFVFLRIMKGQLSYRGNGLSLYIKEPCRDKLYDSIEIYETAYEKAYFSGAMTKQELDEFLFENELYTPFDDRQLEKLKKDQEELKLQAYKSYLNKRELHFIKNNLRDNEKEQLKISLKKSKFHHLTCEGIADLSRWGWIIENSTFYLDGRPYDWRFLDVHTILSHYENSAICLKDFRSIARSKIF